LDFVTRSNFDLDNQLKIIKPVYIEENVFIGAHSTILKGVTIGKNSVVGACSVVTKTFHQMRYGPEILHILLKN